MSRSGWGPLTDTMVEAPPLRADQAEARRSYCRSLASSIASVLGLTITFTGVQATRCSSPLSISHPRYVLYIYQIMSYVMCVVLCRSEAPLLVAAAHTSILDHLLHLFLSCSAMEPAGRKDPT
jgi:hypothetical protein